VFMHIYWSLKNIETYTLSVGRYIAKSYHLCHILDV